MGEEDEEVCVDATCSLSGGGGGVSGWAGVLGGELFPASCTLPWVILIFALIDFGSKESLKLLGGYCSLLSSKGILKALRTLE